MIKVFKFEDTESKTFHSVCRLRGGQPKTVRSVTICGKKVSAMRKTADFEIGDERGSHHFTRSCDVCVAGVTAMFDLLEEAK